MKWSDAKLSKLKLKTFLELQFLESLINKVLGKSFFFMAPDKWKYSMDMFLLFPEKKLMF